MMRRNLLLFLLAIVMAGNVAGLQAYEFETRQNGAEKEVFEKNENITFFLNASDDQDYNITVEDSDGDKVVTDQPMEKLSGAPFHIYQYNYTVGSQAGGTWSAFVNMTINTEATLTETEFQKATDLPRIYNVEHPDFVNVNETFELEAEVSDSKENLKNSTMYIDGTSYDLNLANSRDNYYKYQMNATFSSKGQRDYELVVWDQNGNRDSYSGSFNVKETKNDGTIFKVSVSGGGTCFSQLNDFRTPGNGTYLLGETGYFTEVIENIGFLDMNITINYLNVTYDGNDEWEPGEPFGPVVRNYSGANFTNVTSGEEVTYQEQFIEDNQTGWYTGRTKYTTECYNNETDNYVNFSRTAYETFEVINATGGVSTQGNQSTNETIPANVTEPDGEDTNQTIAQDSNTTGAEGETVEGDNAQPGQTPVPEPEPEPEPEPVPMLSMDIEPAKRVYKGAPGEFIPVNLSVTNEGTEDLADLDILPQLSNRTGWNASQASISSLAVDETVQRQIFIQSADDTDNGTYVIPIVGRNPDNRLDIDYFNVEIVENITTLEEKRPRMSIIESPRSLNIIEGEERPIPVLLENTGELNLTNVSARMQNLDECGTANIGDIEKMEVNETESLNISFQAVNKSAECNTTLIVSSDQNTYAFSRIHFTVAPEEGLIPQEFQVPFIAIAWTSLLSAFAVLRRKYELESVLFKAPFVLLVVGEALIMTFLVVEYYGIVSVSFLPF